MRDFHRIYGLKSVVLRQSCIYGTRQYVQFMQRGVVSVEASTGRYLWRYNAPANGTANISTPIAKDDFVFAASAYGKGGGLLKQVPGQDQSLQRVLLHRESIRIEVKGAVEVGADVLAH